MAASFSKVELMGTLLAAPGVRRNPLGENVCVLPISVVQQIVNSFGRTVDETLNVEIEVGERLAPIVQNGLSQGQILMVEGRLRQYELKPRGRMTVVVAESLQVLGLDGSEQVAEEPADAGFPPDMLDSIQGPEEGEQMPF